MKLFEVVASQPWNKRIAILRTAMGWTLEEAANKCGTDTRVFWSWEAGKNMPRKNSRQAISRAFDVEENEIFNC